MSLVMESRRRTKGRGRGRGDSSPITAAEFDNFTDWTTGQANNSSRGNDKVHSSTTTVETGLKKFEETCAKIQKNNLKYANVEQDYESSEEEENENETDIVQQTVSHYIGGAGDGEHGQDLSRTKQFLLDAFKSGASVCLVCIATIKKTEAIWNCEFCYGIFHLPCIQKWAKESIFYQEQALEDQAINPKTITWFCPKCRYEYKQSQKPTKYLCFCGKEVNPKVDPWLVPHSCGDKCSKPLKPECGHVCLLLCHPGPCPPCPKTIKVSCYCGVQIPQLKRCSAREWSCGQPCGRVLSCGQHKCNQPCHPGVCLPCPKRSVQLCICGNKKAERPCASAIWQCTKVCGRKLACGHHKCEIVCHAGTCDPCPKSGARTCPCGKTETKLPCTEEVPSCGDTCEKLLECGLHSCSQRCHIGPCGLCMQMVTKRCHCGQREKFLPCNKDYRCEIKCKRIRDCRRHPCNRKCCSGLCQPCEQQCGRTLGCHNHKCNSLCHQGPCYPCPLTVDIKCNCGSTAISMPCGREKTTKPPKCTQLCRKSPDCHHPDRTKHSCHFGPCPPCDQKCSKIFPNCQHFCPARCHSAVKVKIQETKKREGPWEPTPAARFEIVNKPCPPCKVPVEVTCLGLHEVSKFHCSLAKPFSCERECGKLLVCGNHTCSVPCHEVLDAPGEKLAGKNCEECEKPCGKTRPVGCTHSCLKMCHPQACEACKQMIKLRCHCQLNTLYIECSKWTTADKDQQMIMSSCNNQCPKNVNCGHRCPVNCHPGSCPETVNCKKKVSMRCPCKRIKKDVACYLAKLFKVECDSKCDEMKALHKEAKLKEEQRKEEEEKKRSQEEVEKFKQKFEGKKRRQRKAKDDSGEEKTIFDNRGFQLLASFGVLALAVIGIYLMY